MKWTTMDSLKWFTLTAIFFSMVAVLLILLHILWPHLIPNELIISFASISGAMWGGVATVLARVGPNNRNNNKGV